MKSDLANLKEKVRVKLKRTHFVDGEEFKPGRIIQLSRGPAEWLVKLNRAVIIK